jgi:hypothetical protein
MFDWRSATADYAEPEKSSANILKRTPLSDPIYNWEKQRARQSPATPAVAQKLVAYLVAVDQRQKESRPRGFRAPSQED